MTDITTIVEAYKASAASLTGLIPGVDGQRSAALARFTKLGMPTAKAEAFRYADLKPLREQFFSLKLVPSTLTSSLPPLLEGSIARFIFVDGVYSEALSNENGLGDITLSVRRLATHFAANPERSAELEQGDDSLALLNTSLMQDGIALKVATGDVIEGAIEFLYVMQDAEGASAHPRLIIDLGENSKLTVVERYIGDNTSFWLNPVTQARLSERSELTHARVAESGGAGIITARTQVRAGTNTTYKALNGLFAGKMTRVETTVKVLGSKASHTIDGISLAATGTRHDTLAHLDHQVPSSNSDQIYRAVSAARGTSSFQGKVTVAKDAQLTEANQSFKALVLDRSGEANAKPELEILADDVKCAHGATIGELDATSLFYLISRGIDPKTARGILIRSFLGDALVRFEGTAVADLFIDQLEAWFDRELTEEAPGIQGEES